MLKTQKKNLHVDLSQVYLISIKMAHRKKKTQFHNSAVNMKQGFFKKNSQLGLETKVLGFRSCFTRNKVSDQINSLILSTREDCFLMLGCTVSTLHFFPNYN